VAAVMLPSGRLSSRHQRFLVAANFEHVLRNSHRDLFSRRLSRDTITAGQPASAPVQVQSTLVRHVHAWYHLCAGCTRTWLRASLVSTPECGFHERALIPTPLGCCLHTSPHLLPAWFCTTCWAGLFLSVWLLFWLVLMYIGCSQMCRLLL
jgi:hypothetical protein